MTTLRCSKIMKRNIGNLFSCYRNYLSNISLPPFQKLREGRIKTLLWIEQAME
jgi:hypothetical protein